MTRDGTTLTIDIFALVPILAILAGLILILWRRSHRKPPNENTDDAPGFSIRALLAPIPLPEGIKLAGFGLWALLFVTLGFGVFFAVGIALIALPDAGGEEGFNLLRGALITVAAITATLGAVVALPFTIRRSIQAERQTRTQEEGYVTDQINSAVANLATLKEISRIWRTVSFDHDGRKIRVIESISDRHSLPQGIAETDVTYGEWQLGHRTFPNIEVRIGAILALERLARERAEVAVRDLQNALQTEPEWRRRATAKLEQAPGTEQHSVYANELERLAHRAPDGVLDHEGARDHVRIMEILCAYIRENAPADQARPLELSPWPKPARNSTPSEKNEARRALQMHRDLWAKQIKSWMHDHPGPRSDIQIALRVLGRRTEVQQSCEGFDTIEKTKQYTKQSVQIPWQGYRPDLRRTDLQLTDLAHSSDHPVNFANARLEDAQIQRANLRAARMQGASLNRAQLHGADLSQAKLQGADLCKAKLQGAHLWEVHLQHAQLRETWLQAADLSEAKLQNSDLLLAKLQGAQFNEARMRGSSLPRTWIQGTDFDGAWMQEVDLQEAQIDTTTNFFPATLRGAGLKSVTLWIRETQQRCLKECFGDATVTFQGSWPEGFVTTGEDGLQRADKNGHLSHWSHKALGYGEFKKQWRAYQETLEEESKDSN